MLRSVRARVTLLAAGVLLAVLAVVAVTVVLTQRAGLLTQLDDSLELDTARWANEFAVGGPAPVLDDDDRPTVVLVDGEVVAFTEDLDREDVAALVGAHDAWSDDGEQFRVAREREGRIEVIVAASTADVDDTVARLVRTLLFIVPLAAAVLAAVVWVLVGRTLRPVDRMRADVDAISLDELDRRVSAPTSDDEIARLAHTMNAMLERLEASNRRQQRFVSDASHELRTPLTRLRAELELLPVTDPAAGAARHSLLAEVVTMQRLVDDLLTLARADARVLGATPATLVDLDDLVLDEARAAGDIDVGAVSAAQVAGDPNALRRLVRNLVDNAARHARSRVAVTVHERAGQAVVIVDDDGPGIAPECRSEVFERFSRLDDARGGAGGTGLGLAIVQAIVDDHGGAVVIDDSPLGGARLIVRLPLAGGA